MENNGPMDRDRKRGSEGASGWIRWRSAGSTTGRGGMPRRMTSAARSSGRTRRIPEPGICWACSTSAGAARGGGIQLSSRPRRAIRIRRGSCRSGCGPGDPGPSRGGRRVPAARAGPRAGLGRRPQPSRRYALPARPPGRGRREPSRGRPLRSRPSDGRLGPGVRPLDAGEDRRDGRGVPIARTDPAGSPGGPPPAGRGALQPGSARGGEGIASRSPSGWPPNRPRRSSASAWPCSNSGTPRRRCRASVGPPNWPRTGPRRIPCWPGPSAYLGRFDEALESAERALRLSPEDPQAYRDRGVLLDELRRCEDAIASYDQAIRRDPGHAETHLNRGVALVKLARYPDAIAAFEEALRRQPDYYEARGNRAACLAHTGRFRAGVGGVRGAGATPQPSRPLASAATLDGRATRRADHPPPPRSGPRRHDPVHPICADAPVRVRPRDRGMPGAAGPPGGDLSGDRSGHHEGDPLPEFDVHSTLTRVMCLITRSVDVDPRADPLHPGRSRAGRPMARSAGHWPGFRVGIAWQGNPKHSRDRDRSFPLDLFERLAGIEGVRLISLQRGAGTEQLHSLGGRFPVIDLGDEVDSDMAMMEDTPAIMMGLDMVIAPDTAVAHLAGALGVPIWLALPLGPDWRWMLDRADSPWYPTARLFRQADLGRWEPVFDRIAAALAERCKSIDLSGRLDGSVLRRDSPRESRGFKTSGPTPNPRYRANRHWRYRAYQLCRACRAFVSLLLRPSSIPPIRLFFLVRRSDENRTRGTSFCGNDSFWTAHPPANPFNPLVIEVPCKTYRYSGVVTDNCPGIRRKSPGWWGSGKGRRR